MKDDYKDRRYHEEDESAGEDAIGSVALILFIGIFGLFWREFKMDFKANIERMEKELKDYNERTNRELKDYNERTNRELAEMRAKLEQSNKPYGWLTNEVKYWFLYSDGRPLEQIFMNTPYDKDRLVVGNVYQTQELAEKARDRQLAKVRIINALREREGDWVADWSDNEQDKCYCYYDHDSKEVYVGSLLSCQEKELEMYSTEQAWQWVVNNMESDVKLYLGVE